MRRFMLFMFILALLMALGTTSYGQSDQPPNSDLQVIDSTPLSGQELDADDDVVLVFNLPLDCDTADDAVSITPAIDYELMCDTGTAATSSLSITPTDSGDGWLPTTTYSITLDDSLSALLGIAHLGEPYTLELNTVGLLSISDALPDNGGIDIATDSVITVVFNRPVVPLVIVEDMPDLPQPLTISPAVEGVGEWLNTSIYLFRPDDHLTPGTTYTVTVNDGLLGVDGSVLADDYQWSFSTIPPQVIGVRPVDGAEDIRLDPTIMLEFNQPMDHDDVELNFYLSPASTTNWVTGTFEWSDDSMSVVFTPSVDDLLEYDTEYAIGLGGTRSAHAIQRDDQSPMPEPTLTLVATEAFGTPVPGTTPLPYMAVVPPNEIVAGENFWTFRTIPLPSVIATAPEDGERDITGGGFVIHFASPMNPETIAGKIHVEPAPQFFEEPEFNEDDYVYQYRVSYPVEWRTEYTVTVDGGMEDIYGSVIEDGFTVTYRTAPAPSSVTLRVPGQMGFYNAYNDNTSLFVNHRNVGSLGLQLYSVSDGAFTDLLLTGSTYSIADTFPQSDDHLLRAWQIDVFNPPDRFEQNLLDLGDYGDCPEAPASRLRVGDLAMVTSDGPVNALAVPGGDVRGYVPLPMPSDGDSTTNNNAPAGDVKAVLYHDYTLPIIGGPACVDDVRWWAVELDSTGQSESAWVAETDENGDYALDLEAPMGAATVAITDDEGDALLPGIYLLNVNTPRLPASRRISRNHMLMVMTTNLTVKASHDSVTVWATDAQSGQPAANAPINIYDPARGLIAAGITDADGLLTVAVPESDDLYTPRVAVLRTDTLFGIGATNWANGIDPGMFGVNTSFNNEDYRVYLYTDRPIYRPDQTVYFRGVVRSRDDMTYTPPDLREVPVRIYSGGEILFDEDVELTPFGTFSGEFQLADDAALGAYVARVDLSSDGGYLYDFNTYATGAISFSVAEYRLPEFQVGVTPALDQVAQGDPLEVAVDGQYYFGGPTSNANVQYSVVARPYFFNYVSDSDDYYNFSSVLDPDETDTDFFNRVIAENEQTMAADGVALLDVPSELETSRSAVFTIEATVYDETQNSVSAHTDVIVHAGLLYLGARPEGYIGHADEEMTVNLIAVDWDSIGIPEQDIDVEVVEQRWYNVQEEDELGRTTWVWEAEEIPVTTGEVSSDEDGKATYTFTPPNGGSFFVRLRTRDMNGSEILGGTRLWVSARARGEYVSWRQDNSNRIDIYADQDSYSVGDTAEILIASPFQGTAEALITVERGGVLYAEHVTMNNNSYVYELPIEENFAPDIFVSVMIVKGVDETNPVAAFRVGLIQLDVDTAHKVLNVGIESDTERAGPQETVTYTLNVTDYLGAPVQAEVGVALTDVASLSLVPPNSPTLLSYFYSEQGLGVRTSTPLTINTDMLTQNVLDVLKGGGGGGGVPGVYEVREEFIDTPYWNATVTTDENGQATFDVLLPDNLTTWRLDARAITSGANGLTLVGQNTHDILSTRPLIIRPAAPRFFVVGDELMLAAVVNNNTGEDLDVEIALEARGVTLTEPDDLRQTVTIAADGRGYVQWPVTVDDVEYVELVFYANAGDHTDASRPALGQGENRLLPVYRYAVPETVGTSGILREGGERIEAIALPPRFNVTQGELTINIEPSLAATTIEGLDFLENYPHDCIEQIVSRFLPNIMTYRALDDLGLADPALEARLDAAVSFALQRLYAEQKADGGWGWFAQEASNPLTTAYALIGLAEARDQGYAVTADVIVHAQAYLETQFVVPSLRESQWVLNRQAFMLYALARSGAPDVARTATLYEHRQRLNLDARAFMALTFHIIDPNETQRSDVLLSDLMNAAIVSATGTHWEEGYADYWNWSTDTRTTALALAAFVKLRPDSDLIPNIVRWLVTHREQFAWETTQETAWAVMSLTDWMTLTGELHPDYAYSVALNGETLIEDEVNEANVRETQRLTVDVGDLLADEVNALAFERTEGEGALYYTAHLRAFLPVPEVEALNRGIIVERHYVLASDDSDTPMPITSAPVGEIVRVRLTIIAPNALHYVVIEDPIPAGAEAINTRLLTSQQIGTRPNISRTDPFGYGWGWWWFSNIDFHDEKVVLYSSYLPAGTYQYEYSLRVGMEGTYNVIPATAQEFYFPEVYGRSAGSVFTITPEE